MMSTAYFPFFNESALLFKDRAENENDPDDPVRWLVVQELAKSWKDEPGMFDFLYN